MIVVRDTREKAGYAFDAARYEGVTVEDGSLATGDYSVKGLRAQKPYRPDHVKNRMVPMFRGDSGGAKPNFSLLIWKIFRRR